MVLWRFLVTLTVFLLFFEFYFVWIICVFLFYFFYPLGYYSYLDIDLDRDFDLEGFRFFSNSLIFSISFSFSLYSFDLNSIPFFLSSSFCSSTLRTKSTLNLSKYSWFFLYFSKSAGEGCCGIRLLLFLCSACNWSCFFINPWISSAFLNFSLFARCGGNCFCSLV